MCVCVCVCVCGLLFFENYSFASVQHENNHSILTSVEKKAPYLVHADADKYSELCHSSVSWNTSNPLKHAVDMGLCEIVAKQNPDVLSIHLFKVRQLTPKGGRRISDVSSQSGINLRAASLIPLFYISSLVLLPSPVAISVLSFSAVSPFSWSVFP